MKDPLFILIKSLSKSEKRQFALYAGRIGSSKNTKYMALFHFLDKAKSYNEQAILDSRIVSKAQLSNLKAHLYRQILVSLRLNPAHQQIPLKIRELLDFATILFHKGLYHQSLRLLDRAKSLALENEEKNLAYEVVELEKIIESQYITRSMEQRTQYLTRQSEDIAYLNDITARLSNLSLWLYSKMLKNGYVKNKKEAEVLSEFFFSHLPPLEHDRFGFREKMWYYKVNVWYFLQLQNFISAFKFSEKWVLLFFDHPEMISQHPVFFLKGNHYLMESLFFLTYHSKLKEYLERLENLISTGDLLPDMDYVKVLSFMYTMSNRLNLYFMEGSFDKGLPMVHDILEGLMRYEALIDIHHVMLFYYKIACLYFGAGDYIKCIDFLSRIIDQKNLMMRQDLMCFARILNLVAKYEAGMDDDLDREVVATYRFLLKMDDMYEVQREMMKFLKNLGRIYPQDLKAELIKLKDALKKIEHVPFERRAFLYLDVISWIESRIHHVPVSRIIYHKFLATKR